VRRVLAPLIGVVLLVAAPALAQVSVEDVSDQVSTTGLYVEPGLEADTASIGASITRSGNAGYRLMVVLLGDDPAGGAVTFADAVQDRTADGTVLVLSATGEALVSTDFDQAALADALDDGFAASARADTGQGDAAFVSAVVDSLTGTSASTGTAEVGSSGGSSSGLIIMLVIIGGLVLLVWFAIRKGRKSAKERDEGAMEGARSEIRSQLDAMANTILEITDFVNASESSTDDTYLREASATFSEADESFTGALTLRALEDLSDRLDEARWQLDAAAAIAGGEPVPPKPPKEQRYACFFDPTHANASETAEISTPAGKQTVRVCKEDAEKLRRGAQPKPRMIDVKGRRVPAPMAPRSHGGGGFDWLEVFSVLAGGMGQATSYDWGGSTAGTAGRRRRSTTTSRRSTSTRRGTSSGRARAGRTRRRKR
jgi:hypothetical protein